eukprot:3695083-Amphidinium_carterae.1
MRTPLGEETQAAATQRPCKTCTRTPPGEETSCRSRTGTPPGEETYRQPCKCHAAPAHEHLLGRRLKLQLHGHHADPAQEHLQGRRL